jgi:hypothetical protein
LLELTVQPNPEPQVMEEQAEVVAFEETPAAHSVEPSETRVEADLDVIEESDEPFLMAEPEVEAPKAEPVKETSTQIESSFAFEEAPSGSKMPLVAGAIVVLLLAAVGGWMFLGTGSSPEPARPSVSQTSVTPAEPASQPVPAEQQSVPADPAQSVQSAAPEQPSEAPDVVSPEQTQSRNTAKPTQAKPAKPSAEPAKTPEKKKVTVDDLINDN